MRYCAFYTPKLRAQSLRIDRQPSEVELREIVGPALVYSVNHLLKWSHGQKLVETQSSICSHLLTPLSPKGCERALDVIMATA